MLRNNRRPEHDIATAVSDDRLLAVGEALSLLEADDPELEKLVKLRFLVASY